MRVLLVTHRYPPFGVTGVERVAEQTAESLQAGGDEVTVLTKRETAAPPFPILERTQRRGVAVTMISGGGHLHGRFPRFAPALERLFEQVLLEVDPDVVLASHLLDHSPGYVSIARRWGVPVILELHDYYAVCELARLERRWGGLCRGPEGGHACAVHCFPEQPQTDQRWALRTHMFRRALELSTALIAPSRFVEDYFRAAFGPSLPPLHVIGNGVDVRADRPRRLAADDPLSVGYIGTVIPHKGVHVLIDALRLARLPAARLLLFGGVVGPYLEKVLEGADRIENLECRAFGQFDPAQLPMLLDEVDVLVVPSLSWETYSLVIREAYACGVPVIASRIGALPEGVREGENGLLFEPGSASSLAAHLQTLSVDRSRLQALRDGIRPTDWLTVEERTNRLRALITEVLADRAHLAPNSSDLTELSILRDALDEVPAA